MYTLHRRRLGFFFFNPSKVINTVEKLISEYINMRTLQLKARAQETDRAPIIPSVFAQSQILN